MKNQSKAAAKFPAGNSDTDAVKLYHAALLLAVGEVEKTETELAALPATSGRTDRLAGATPLGAKIGIGIRPEHATIDPDGAVSGKITLVEQLGGMSTIRIDSFDITVQIAGQTALNLGDTAHVGLPRHALHVFDEAGLALPKKDAA